MRTLLTALCAVSILASGAARADWGRPVPPPPPGFGDHHDGWDHHDHGGGWGRPGWGRPLPPPPPVFTQTQYVNCESNGYNLNYCAVPGFIVNAAVTSQNSFAPCQLGNSYGFQGNQLWVKDGCRATFVVQFRR